MKEKEKPPRIYYVLFLLLAFIFNAEEGTFLLVYQVCVCMFVETARIRYALKMLSRASVCVNGYVCPERVCVHSSSLCSLLNIYLTFFIYCKCLTTAYDC